MASLLKWTINSGWEALISTGANSLANGSSVLSSAITNGTDDWTQLNLSLLLASLTPGSNAYVEAHICYLNQDASHYDDLGPNTLVGTFQIVSGAAAKYLTLPGIYIAPIDFKVGLVNQAGVSFASSGNVLKGQRAAINGNA